MRFEVVAVGVALLLGLSSCGSSSAPQPETVTARVKVAHARFPVALTPDGNGGLLYAERLTGRVRRIAADGRLDPTPVARVAVATAGQRGLLGLAVDPARRVFAAYTTRGAGREIQIAQVAPTFRLVWAGPPSSTLANGGHLVYDAGRSRLIVGIGDLQDRARTSDPLTPNGKLLLLDPDGLPDQRPIVLSTGWNNPFAFTRTARGRLWVADNVPGEQGERLARGDLAGRPTHVTRLPPNTVPSALAAVSDRTLLVCGFARGRILRYDVRGGRAVATSGPGARAHCGTGVAYVAATRRLWLADAHSIGVVTLG